MFDNLFVGSLKKNKRIKIFALFVLLMLPFTKSWSHGISLYQRDTTITLKTIENLQYDVVRFVVKPGQKVHLILDNTDKMEHNLIITRPGSRLKVVNAAMRMGSEGKQKDFIPDLKDDILWSIKVLNHNERDSVSFTAPAEEGAYPYVCTFPGHGFVMYGAMYVSKSESMPGIKDDKNIPPARRK